jgi:hypothetical protein
VVPDFNSTSKGRDVDAFRSESGSMTDELSAKENKSKRDEMIRCVSKTNCSKQH